MTEKTKGTDKTTYLWEGVPRQLVQDAINKAKARTPPTSLKAVLVGLLHRWTYGRRAHRDPF